MKRDWKKIEVNGIANIEKCVGEFNITELINTPHGKFKIKVFEKRNGKYVGYTNLQIKDKDGCPFSAVGYGNTISDALEDTILYFLKMIEEKENITIEDYVCSDSFDFQYDNIGFLVEILFRILIFLLKFVEVGGKTLAKHSDGIAGFVKGTGHFSKWWHAKYVDNLTDSQIMLGLKQSEKSLSIMGSASKAHIWSAGKMKSFRYQYKSKERMFRANFEENVMVNATGGWKRTGLRNVHIDIFE